MLSCLAGFVINPCSLTPPRMLRQSFHEFTLPTRGRGLYEFTSEVVA